jgi:hypothetical protein
MKATASNLIKAYPKLPKGQKGKIRRAFTQLLEKDADVLNRRINAGKFLRHEEIVLNPKLEELFPEGFTVTEKP